MKNFPLRKMTDMVLGWVLAAHLFFVIRSTGLEELDTPVPFHNLLGRRTLFEATGSGVLIGIIFGAVNILLDTRSHRRLPSGFLILLRTFFFLLALYVGIGVVYIGSHALFLNQATPHIIQGLWLFYGSPTYWFILLYAGLVAILINFIYQVNLKLGPGNLLKLLKGTYQTPREEKRIFMFLDMKSSTVHAESLGHVRYSQLIQDCFFDLTEAVIRNKAEIYQYVGDEAILTWTLETGLNDDRCLNVFFDFVRVIQNKAHYYRQQYGLVPEFKAGIHLGPVIAVEVGEIKREIVYHGDVLNTAARIQGKCNELTQTILLSETVQAELGENSRARLEPVGATLLRGKKEPLLLYSVMLPA